MRRGLPALCSRANRPCWRSWYWVAFYGRSREAIRKWERDSPIVWSGSRAGCVGCTIAARWGLYGFEQLAAGGAEVTASLGLWPEADGLRDAHEFVEVAHCGVDIISLLSCLLMARAFFRRILCCLGALLRLLNLNWTRLQVSVLPSAVFCLPLSRLRVPRAEIYAGLIAARLCARFVLFSDCLSLLRERVDLVTSSVHWIPAHLDPVCPRSCPGYADHVAKSLLQTALGAVVLTRRSFSKLRGGVAGSLSSKAFIWRLRFFPRFRRGWVVAFPWKRVPSPMVVGNPKTPGHSLENRDENRRYKRTLQRVNDQTARPL